MKQISSQIPKVWQVASYSYNANNDQWAIIVAIDTVQNSANNNPSQTFLSPLACKAIGLSMIPPAASYNDSYQSLDTEGTIPITTADTGCHMPLSWTCKKWELH